jgi:hypothetical protein
MSFFGFGKKAKEAEAAKLAQRQTDMHNLWLTEQESLKNLKKGANIPEGYNAMEKFNKNLVNKARAKDENAKAKAASAKAAENARILAEQEAATEKKCMEFIKTARENLLRIRSMDDLDYYFRMYGKIENSFFPTFRQFINTTKLNEKCAIAVNEFIDYFQKYVFDNFGYEGDRYLGYFRRYSNGGAARKRRVTRKSTRKTHRKTRRV